jgi:2-oxoglutarate-dependent dioxygenase
MNKKHKILKRRAIVDPAIACSSDFVMKTELLHPLHDTLRQAVRPVSAGEIKQYKEDGYFLFRNMVSPEAAEELKSEIADIMEIIGLGTTKLRQTAQYLHNSLLAAYVQGSLLKGVASALMEAPAHLYLPFTAVKSGGGGGKFHFHQDGNYTPYLRGQGINLWTALVPMRDENGGLRIVPESHRHGAVASENAGDNDAHRKTSTEPEHSLLLEMEPGDCVAFTRWTIHGSGPNRTNEHRIAYAVQFHSEDAVAEFGGAKHLLIKEPRFADIWGVDKIVAANAGARDGH